MGRAVRDRTRRCARCSNERRRSVGTGGRARRLGWRWRMLAMATALLMLFLPHPLHSKGVHLQTILYPPSRRQSLVLKLNHDDDDVVSAVLLNYGRSSNNSARSPAGS
jgi:hypothetical protein